MKRLLSWVLLVLTITASQPMLSEEITTRIHLIRHGETDFNQAKRLQGHTDIPLNERGIQQAQQARETWHARPIVACYSSDLQRAFETARLLVDGKGLNVSQDARLREQSFGRHEGLTIAEFRQVASPDDLDIEGDHLVRTRAIAALTDIARAHPGGEVLVVSHGGVIRSVVEHVSGESADSFRTDNLAHVTLQYGDGSWAVVDMRGVVASI